MYLCREDLWISSLCLGDHVEHIYRQFWITTYWTTISDSVGCRWAVVGCHCHRRSSKTHPATDGDFFEELVNYDSLHDPLPYRHAAGLVIPRHFQTAVYRPKSVFCCEDVGRHGLVVRSSLWAGYGRLATPHPTSWAVGMVVSHRPPEPRPSPHLLRDRPASIQLACLPLSMMRSRPVPMLQPPP